MEKELKAYHTPNGEEPFRNWLNSLRDKTIVYRVRLRIDRIRYGNYGDHKRFNDIIELRLHFGKGYRVYCGEDGNSLVILLAGGDKSSQVYDIEKAIEYWRNYREQN